MPEPDLFQTLLRFHREIALPDMQRMVEDAIKPLRNEIYDHFDGVYVRFDRGCESRKPLQNQKSLTLSSRWRR